MTERIFSLIRKNVTVQLNRFLSTAQKRLEDYRKHPNFFRHAVGNIHGHLPKSV